MTNTTKIIVAVVAVAAIGGAAFWAYKAHPEWFGKPSQQVQNPNQVNPAAPQEDSLAQQINAGTNALETLSNTLSGWLG